MKSRRFRIEHSEFVERERENGDRFKENDIPGASLSERRKSELKNDELRFRLKCRNDSAKGLRTKAQLVKR